MSRNNVKTDSAKRHLRSFWNGDGQTVFSVYPHDYEYRQIGNLDEMAGMAVINLTSGDDLPGTNVPRLTIDFGTVSTASFWGGKVYRPDGGCIWIDPIIHSTDDIDRLHAAPPRSGDFLKAVSLYENVSRRMDSQNLPCSMYDLQGPLNTLSLMWEQQDMMLSMIDSPEEVHRALDMVTDHLIQQIKAFHEDFRNIEAPLWPFIWLPTDIGIGITEDYMPLLSPDLYKEFGIPYVERLSREFNGLFIHCCGCFSQHIDNLAESDINILGMEFVYPNIDIEKLFKTFGDTAVFVPNIMDKSIEEFGSMTGYMKHVHDLREEGTRLWYILRPDLPDFTSQVEFLESITDVI